MKILQYNFINKIINKLIYQPDRFLIRWWIFIPVTVLMFISFITLKHTSLDAVILQSTFLKQIIWFGFGCIIFHFFQWIRIQFFQEYAYHFYGILLILILITYFMPEIGGANRWISFGSISFQPSELGKIILVFIVARILSDQKDNVNQVKLLLITLVTVMVPSSLIFNQPDFGTAIIYSFLFFPMLYWSGINSYYLFVIIAPIISIISAFNIIFFSIWMGLLILAIYISQPRFINGVIQFVINILFGVLSPYIWNNVLYPHQRSRILTLINPMSDPHGAGYQVIQSIIAIGSGGIWGKGIGEGTQTQLRYLPVRDTDFIISVIAEEWGLFGIMVILISFYILIYWLIIYAGSISNEFSSLVLIGFASILFAHLVVNMGMTVGLLPVTGLPAPFLSYGGSFLITCLIILGIANNIINYHIK